MARYMLDTKMCIYLMKRQPEEIARRLAQCSVGDVVISAITYAELEYGVVASTDPASERTNLENLIEDIPVAPFDATAGTTYGPIRLTTRDSRADHLDKLIAAHAAALGTTIVTNNVRNFAKYPAVIIENWLTPTS
ncbi:type II toxin-antitoxin system VapC family toxin [Rhodoblastus sp.]|uniref:type II toxin-antitoxin system VapC family toxin n=1 Tax=Rhodoblastus sp. TaxID=1962975 RepID=UPI002625CEFA|nr:type II toxin-antitoxin system VapC family toxin [Rhodoblastus sp.]